MKIFTVANQKGGVGKTAFNTQYSFYLNLERKQRVLALDFDHQRNFTNPLIASGKAVVSKTVASDLFLKPITSIEEGELVLVPADHEGLRRLEKQGDLHNQYLQNLYTFFKSVSSQFDVCIIDTNPNPDIRVTAALVLSDYTLSPFQLNQEAIDGLGAFRTDIAKIKAKMNPKLQVIGILPNLVEPTPFQRENFTQVASAFGQLMIDMGPGQPPAAIPRRTALTEAQAAAMPIWQMPKTAARSTWKEIRPVFERIAQIMGV